MTKEEQIAELKNIIKQGEELERQGYPTGLSNEMNKFLLRKLEEE